MTGRDASAPTSVTGSIIHTANSYAAERPLVLWDALHMPTERRRVALGVPVEDSPRDTVRQPSWLSQLTWC